MEEKLKTEKLNDNTIKEEVVDIKKEGKKKKKDKKPLTKKQKIIIIVASAILVGIIIFLVWFFILRNEEEKETPKEDPGIVIELNNYRYDNGKLIFLDSNNKEIGTYECINKNQEKCMLALYSQEEVLAGTKYLDETGEVMHLNTAVYLNEYVLINDFENEEDKSVILYNLKTNEVVGTYLEVKRMSSTQLILKNTDNLYGVIELLTGEVKMVVEFEYDYLGILESMNNIAYEKDGKYGLVDQTGTQKVSNLSNEIISYNDKNLVVSGNNNDYSLYDYQKEKLLDKEFDFITIDSNYIYLYEKDNLYIRDLSLNKLNEEAFSVDSENGYLDSVTLDENYSIKETNKLIEITEDSGIVSFKTNNDTYNVNIYEINLSSTYNYVSYIDQVLYFYSDEAKEELLGKYTCDNKNIVESDTKSFTNCFIAKESNNLNRVNKKDTVGYIPIYNNTFAFIQDKKNLSTSNSIILYNIAESKNLPTYDSIDVGYYNTTDNIVLAEANNLLIYASNTNKLFGVLKLNGASITGLIPFEYKTIEYLGDVFLATKEDETQGLYDQTGKTILDPTIGIKNEIIDYTGGYIKVKDSSNNYLVYSTSGSIISDPAVDIKLGSNVYASLLSTNKIDVYKYANGKTSILANQIDYTGASFDLLDKGSSGFEISIKDSDGKQISIYKYNASGVEIN